MKYGLTTGTEKSDNVSPTELGLKIASPASEQERVQGLVQAALKPEFLGRILRHYNKNKLPEATFLRNTLQKQFSVDASLSEECTSLIVENAKYVGFLQDISGSKYIRIVGSTTETSSAEAGTDADGESNRIEPPAFVAVAGVATSKPETATKRDPAQSKKIFVAHGKNRKPLEALKKILEQFKIPYVVAVDEPHRGRPISAKVAQLMAECNAGIFVFTKDERFLQHVEGHDPVEVFRPSENVVYELGAASVLWERRIIILREDGVTSPTDFSDLGYITFQGDEVASKALDLLKELVALGLVLVRAA